MRARLGPFAEVDVPDIRKRAPKGSMPPNHAGRLILSVPEALRAAVQRQAKRDGISEAEWWRRAAAEKIERLKG